MEQDEHLIILKQIWVYLFSSTHSFGGYLFGNWGLESRNLKLEIGTRNPQYKTRNPQHGTRNSYPTSKPFFSPKINKH